MNSGKQATLGKSGLKDSSHHYSENDDKLKDISELAKKVVPKSRGRLITEGKKLKSKQIL